MPQDLKKYIDVDILNKITRLELKARHIVEGFLSGMHKSPYHGFSVEFAAHREYTQGDDLRHLDWKVFGRTDKLYIKEYELETNLRANILLDTSESMAYGSKDITKLELACFIAASMSYLLIKQQDAVGIICFDKEIKTLVPSTTGQGHIRSLLECLASSQAENKTDITYVFHALAEKIKRRGLVIIISDLFDHPQAVLNGLQYFISKNHDVIVFHVMDSYELEFPFKNLTRFEGLEEYPKVFCDPISIRKAYLQEVQDYLQTISRGCRIHMVDYEIISTDKNLDVELTRFLARRLGTRPVRRKRG